MGLGFTEVLIIVLVILVIFGGKRLPEVGEGMGKAIRNFKRSFSEPEEIDVTADKEKKEDSGSKNGQNAKPQ